LSRSGDPRFDAALSRDHRRKLVASIAALGADTPAVATAASHDALASADAERRQLTVMICDLVGSTALSARLDLRNLRA
jgi:class 3 adenylate cyclase